MSIVCIHIISVASSGGNKRKVSAAVAFMANPALVFLDEPTTVNHYEAKSFEYRSI